MAQAQINKQIMDCWESRAWLKASLSLPFISEWTQDLNELEIALRIISPHLQKSGSVRHGQKSRILIQGDLRDAHILIQDKTLDRLLEQFVRIGQYNNEPDGKKRAKMLRTNDEGYASLHILIAEQNQQEDETTQNAAQPPKSVPEKEAIQMPTSVSAEPTLLLTAEQAKKIETSILEHKAKIQALKDQLQHSEDLLTSERSKLRAEQQSLEAEKGALERKLGALQERIDNLDTDYQAMLASQAKEMRRLSERLEKLQEELAQEHQQRMETEEALKRAKTKRTSLRSMDDLI